MIFNKIITTLVCSLIIIGLINVLIYSIPKNSLRTSYDLIQDNIKISRAVLEHNHDLIISNQTIQIDKLNEVNAKLDIILNIAKHPNTGLKTN